jgi:hypothetical protein
MLVKNKGNILFIGDSHCHGYWYDKSRNKVWLWDENNYSTIYATKIAEQRCYVYSQGGAPNRKYVRWIRYMLETHSDIAVVSLQATYWDRWLLACNLIEDGTPGFGFPKLPLGYFTRQFANTDKFALYDDNETNNGNIVEWTEKPHWIQKIKLHNDGYPDNTGKINWPGYERNYMQIKLFNDLLTHVTNEDYHKDIALIDAMCAERDIPVFLWRINKRVDLPLYNNFRDLTNVSIVEQPANEWINDQLGVDIETMKLDEEHYNVEAHELIAYNFIPSLLQL